MQHVGIDIGKKACNACLLDDHGANVRTLEFANDPNGWSRLGSLITPGDALVLEASTYAYALHDHFCRAGYQVVAAHPKGVRLAAHVIEKYKASWLR